MITLGIAHSLVSHIILIIFRSITFACKLVVAVWNLVKMFHPSSLIAAWSLFDNVCLECNARFLDFTDITPYVSRML